MAELVTFSLLLGVGTGGDYTPNYHLVRSEKAAFSKPRANAARRSNGFAITADIEHIKLTLNLTMSELARCLGVSRQAPYNWIAGGPIKESNLLRLNELKSAADIIAAANLPERALLLRRKLPGGKTLIETIAVGGSGAEAADSLVRMVIGEDRQRAALVKLFANRRPKTLLGPGTPELADNS